MSSHPPTRRRPSSRLFTETTTPQTPLNNAHKQPTDKTSLLHSPVVFAKAVGRKDIEERRRWRRRRCYGAEPFCGGALRMRQLAVNWVVAAGARLWAGSTTHGQ